MEMYNLGELTTAARLRTNLKSLFYQGDNLTKPEVSMRRRLLQRGCTEVVP